MNNESEELFYRVSGTTDSVVADASTDITLTGKISQPSGYTYLCFDRIRMFGSQRCGFCGWTIGGSESDSTRTITIYTSNLSTGSHTFYANFWLIFVNKSVLS